MERGLWGEEKHQSQFSHLGKLLVFLTKRPSKSIREENGCWNQCNFGEYGKVLYALVHSAE